MIHSSVDSPARCSRTAASAKLSSFPAETSASNCLSQCFASNAQNHSRNFASSSAGNLEIEFSSSWSLIPISLSPRQTSGDWSAAKCRVSRLGERMLDVQFPGRDTAWTDGSQSSNTGDTCRYECTEKYGWQLPALAMREYRIKHENGSSARQALQQVLQSQWTACAAQRVGSNFDYSWTQRIDGTSDRTN